MDNKKKLYQDNRRLVEKMARSFADKGVAEETLIMAGEAALRKAIEELGNAEDFSNQAAWWIRQSMEREVRTLKQTRKARRNRS